MRRFALAFLKRCGALIGRIFYYFPRRIKRMLVKLIGFSVTKTSGKFSSLTYIIGYDIVKHIYFGSNSPEIFSRTIFKNVSINVDVTKKTQRIIYLQKTYEPYIFNYLKKNVRMRNGDTFIDIGANVGFYTLLAAKLVGREGVVLSFEPENRNYEMLIENIRLNKFTNVFAVQKAVGNKNASMTLNRNPLNDGGGSLMTLDHYPDDEEVWSTEKIKHYFPNFNLTQNTEVVTLDSYLESIKFNVRNGRNIIIKIDVEGNEYNVLEGMRHLLNTENAPDIICEVSRDGDKIADIMHAHKYRFYTLDKEGNPYFLGESIPVKEKVLLFSKR